MLTNIKIWKGALSCRLGFFAQLPQRAFAHAPLGFVASLSLKPRKAFFTQHRFARWSGVFSFFCFVCWGECL